MIRSSHDALGFMLVTETLENCGNGWRSVFDEMSCRVLEVTMQLSNIIGARCDANVFTVDIA